MREWTPRASMNAFSVSSSLARAHTMSIAGAIQCFHRAKEIANARLDLVSFAKVLIRLFLP